MARLLSVNVGLPRNVSWRGERVFTGVWKEPVQGGRMVRRLNVVGDGQGDLLGHGGEHRAVLVYQMDSYRYWEQQLGRSNFTFGRFGENFTVEGLQDAEVCIGDRYRIGGALFEVTQPCVTCYRVGIRMEEPQMAALLVSHHRPGFYMRVLEEGEVGRRDSEGCLWTGARNHSRNRCSVVPARTLTRTVGALACDVPVRWACRTGVCHTCECGLISGAVEYGPDPLEPPAEGNVLICCSRPRRDIEIDL